MAANSRPRTAWPCLLLLLVLAGCGGGPGPSTPAPPPETALRIAGSGATLAALHGVVAAYQQAYPAARFEFDRVSTTAGAVDGLMGQVFDLVAISRPVAEVTGAASLDYRAFARDPMVFAVHAPNPVRGLSTAQVQDLYGGSATTWQVLGGGPDPVVVLDRPDGQSVRKQLLLPVLGARPVRARTTVLGLSEEMVAALDSTPNAVGYTPLAEMRGLPSAQVQVLALNGVTPDAAAVRSGAYPWYLTHYLLLRPDGPLTARRFADWVRGPDGQRALEELGYVGVAR